MTISNNTSADGGNNKTTGTAATKQNGSTGGRSGGGDQAINTTTNRSQQSNAKQQQLTKSKANDRERERTEREQLVLWRQPLQTLKYSGKETLLLLETYGDRMLANSVWICAAVAAIVALVVLQSVDGWHQPLLVAFRENIGFVVYWVGLGVVSSVGLGTGLHTFLLYLGPHIASVTLAAYECNSLDFPSPPYPDE